MKKEGIDSGGATCKSMWKVIVGLFIFVVLIVLLITLDKTNFFTKKNINISNWITFFSTILGTLLAVGGTYYYTMKSNIKVMETESKIHKETLDNNLKLHDEQMKLEKEIQYRIMNKNNIKEVFESLKAFDYLMQKVEVDLYIECMLNHSPYSYIEKNLKEIKFFLQKLKSDFYYDTKVVSAIDKTLENISKVTNLQEDEIFRYNEDEFVQSRIGSENRLLILENWFLNSDMVLREFGLETSKFRSIYVDVFNSIKLHCEFNIYDKQELKELVYEIKTMKSFDVFLKTRTLKDFRFSLDFSDLDKVVNESDLNVDAILKYTSEFEVRSYNDYIRYL